MELDTGAEIDLLGLGNEGGGDLLKWARLDGEDVPDVGEAIELVGGIARPANPGELLPGEDEAFWPSGDKRTGCVVARASLPPPWFTWYIAHGGGHLVAYRNGHDLGDLEEEFASIVGRAALMPQRSMARVWHRLGDPRRLLRWWEHVPPTHVALRLGESRVANVWLATRNSIRERRAERPAEKAIVLEVARKALDRGPGECAERRGYIATMLPDDPRLAIVVGPEGSFGF